MQKNGSFEVVFLKCSAFAVTNRLPNAGLLIVDSSQI
jgi:hypothetical protein